MQAAPRGMTTKILALTDALGNTPALAFLQAAIFI